MACEPQQQSATASADRGAGGSVPPAKKRRKITHANNSSMETLLAAIDSHVYSCEKITAPEQLRITMLRDACRNNDYFYIALHQMFCLWTSRPLRVVVYLEQDETELEVPFSIIGKLINENTTISVDHAEFFSNFPGHISKSDQYNPTLISVEKFLLDLPVEWPKYRSECARRRCPPLVVDEVGKRFNLVSVIFQRVISTAIRKDMGFPEIGDGDQMDQIFHPRAGLGAGLYTTAAPPSVEIAVGTSRPTDAEVWNYLCSPHHIIKGRIDQKVQPAFLAILKQKWIAQSFEDRHLDKFVAIWLNPAYKEFATKLASGPAAEVFDIGDIHVLKQCRIEGWYVLLNGAADRLKMVFEESSSFISPVDFRSILRGLAQNTDDYKINLHKLFWDGGNRREEFLSYLTVTEYSEAYTTIMMHLPDSAWNLQLIMKEIREYGNIAKKVMLRVHRDLLLYNVTSGNIHHSGRQDHSRNLGSNTSPIKEISAGISTNDPQYILSERHQSATAHPAAPQTSNMVLVEVPEPALSVKCGCAEAIRPNSELIPIPLLKCACSMHIW
ncbi:hypothetical protein V496_01696 [Pseudogymnoascus sp. VKM F-4515 (FW-2607)]|nr:hypothetical protein V496_01696 [Pseudogymnoascus sp. VKM F-4515 (FW-2607)]